jgi:hypothetical protein
MASYLKSEAKSVQRSFEMMRSIDKKCGLLNLLFVAEFVEEQQGELGGSGLKQPGMKEFIGFWIDSGVQPVSFVVDPNHCLIHRDLIRSLVARWL